MEQTSKENRRKVNISKILWPVLTFLLVWGIQVGLNFFISVPHSLPDEMGALSLASKLGGSDWSHIAGEKGMYFGFGTTLPFFWLFHIFKDPIALYRSFLGAGAFLRSLPVFICFSLGRNYLKFHDRVIALLSVIAVLLTPTTGAKIDNEPMMLLMGWLMFYLIIRIKSAETKGRTAICLVLLAIVCGYSMTVHTRALGYILAAVVTLIFIGFTSQKGNRIRIFAAIAITALVVVFIVVLNILAASTGGNLWVTTGSDKANTIGSLINSALYNLYNTGNGDLNGLPYLNIFISNMLTVFVFSVGLIPLFIVFIPLKFIKTKGFTKAGRKERAYSTGTVFLWISFVVYLVGLMFVWATPVYYSMIGATTLARGVFYLRYIGSMFGPCAFVMASFLYKKKPKAWIFVGIVAFIAAILYPVYSMNLVSYFEAERTNGDFFCFYSVLNSFKYDFNNNGQDLWYFILPVLIALALFIVVQVLSELKQRIILLIFFVIFSIFQYSSLVLKCDRPQSVSAYLWGDSLYDVLQERPDAFDNVKTVYYISDAPGETVQVLLGDIPVYLRVPEEESENMVIYMKDIDDLFEKVGIDLSGMKPYLLDKNEVIVTNDRKLERSLDKYIKGK